MFSYLRIIQLHCNEKSAGAIFIQKRLTGTYHIKENSWLARIAGWKLKGTSTAIVWGKTIHLYGISRQNFLEDVRFLRHELKHVEQYRQYGFLRFIFLYLQESIRNGYYNNSFEKEARLAEHDQEIISRFTLK